MCELIQEAGLSPYNVEAFSCYLSGSHAEQIFLRQAEHSGLSEMLCSYHKTFIGAVQKSLLPRSKWIVYMNLTCDANLLTFKYLADMYEVPSFFIDVPDADTKIKPDSVVYAVIQHTSTIYSAETTADIHYTNFSSHVLVTPFR